MTTAIPMQAFAAGRRSAERFPKHVIPAIIVIYACMLPRELSIATPIIVFQPYRIALVLMFPFLVFQGMRGQVRPSAIDAFVFSAAIWAIIALTMTENIASALKTGLAEGLIFILAYFAGRVSIRNGRDFKAIVPWVIPGLVICTLIMFVESVTHTLLLRPTLGRLLNVPSEYFYDERYGLMRGLGPFPHPILAGVFLASFLPLVWYCIDRPWLRAVGLFGVGGFFFSLSSTGFVGFFVSIGLMIASLAQKLTKLPIFIMMTAGGLVAAVAISLVSESGLFSFLVRHLTLSSASGFYRIAIWTNAGAEVLANPIFGIGTRQYERPAWMISSSVDAHWLLLALRYGIPYVIAVLVTTISATVMALRYGASPDPVDHKVGRAIGFSLIALIFTGLSVYLWEGVETWMMLLTGMAVSFGQYLARWRMVPARPVARQATGVRRYA